ncbi:AlpA family phage regulatory protein [Duganella sp. FT94W]|uniref:AlpA family phage regulatory protein n=1 Tax=Duganella lactea TaxID=2692173 RepID=A0ABW9V2X2_9BURK|nr:AlpA family phage regulatory protein [Duganella lactea]MYM34046.1 AlpA family phage regulatory protein [Duganella lactea]
MKTTEDELPYELKEIIRRVKELANDRMLRLPQASGKLGLATSTYWKGVKEGTIPPQVPLGPRISAWRESELQAWIDAKTYAARNNLIIDMKAFVSALTSK